MQRLEEILCTYIHSGTTYTTHNNLRLQAWMPSTHVRLNCLSPTFPQFLNQAPPRAQQLCLPDLFLKPHFEHLAVAIADVGMTGGCVLVLGRTIFRVHDNNIPRLNASWILCGTTPTCDCCPVHLNWVFPTHRAN